MKVRSITQTSAFLEVHGAPMALCRLGTRPLRTRMEHGKRLRRFLPRTGQGGKLRNFTAIRFVLRRAPRIFVMQGLLNI